jgi:hypothetical protein
LILLGLGNAQVGVRQPRCARQNRRQTRRLTHRSTLKTYSLELAREPLPFKRLDDFLKHKFVSWFAASPEAFAKALTGAAPPSK